MKRATNNRKPLPQPRTEGERLLRLAAEGMTLDKLARSLAVRHRAHVASWLNGERRPSPDHRATIAAVYNVPPEAWDYRPGGVPFEPPTQPGNTLTSAGGPSHDEAALPVVPPAELDGPTPTALEDCMSMLRAVRVQLAVPNLAPSQAIKLADAKTKLIVLRARLERDAERSEDRIVREHPAFKRLCRIIVKTLAKHPAALKDLAAALGEENIDLTESTSQPPALAAGSETQASSTQPRTP